MEAESGDVYLERLVDLLRSHGEPQRAAAAQRDKGSRYTFFAIRVPVLRRVATKAFDLRGLTARQRLKVYDYIWNHTEVYEAMSVPLLYYRQRGRRIDDDAFDTLRHWIDRIDNWGHCDDLSTVYSYCNHQNPEKVTPFLREWNASDNIWRIRTSLVSLVHYSGKNAVYLSPEEVLPMLDPHLANENKYVANAVGWVLRETRRRYRVDVDSYITANAGILSNIARRKAGV